MLQKLQRAGFKVECYSLSFHHKTFWPNPDGSAKSLARFLEEKGLKEYKLALVGHSLGGIVIKAFAVKNWEEAWGFEVAGIVTVDSPHNGVTKSLGKILGNALIGPHSSVMEAGKTQRYILSVLQRL